MAMTIEPCGDCGMPCEPGEYHPFAACLMFKACHKSDVVRANLQFVVDHGKGAHLTQPAQAVDVGELLIEAECIYNTASSIEASPVGIRAVVDYLARALAGEKADGWRDIATAPKDGSVILVNDTTGEAPWVAAKWLEGEQWSGWIYDDELALDNNPVGPLPTVWFQLPPTPPSDGEE